MTRSTSPFRLGAVTSLILGVAVADAFPSFAQQMEPAASGEAIKQKSVYERFWELPRLYHDQENSVIQSFSLLGRYNGQYWNVNTDQGSGDGWENRRFYLGAQAVLFHDFTVVAQIKTSENFDPFYDGLYEAFVKWSPSQAFSLTVGQMDFGFAGLERSISSTKLVTFERGLLANQLADYTGASIADVMSAGQIPKRLRESAALRSWADDAERQADSIRTAARDLAETQKDKAGRILKQSHKGSLVDWESASRMYDEGAAKWLAAHEGERASGYAADRLRENAGKLRAAAGSLQRRAVESGVKTGLENGSVLYFAHSPLITDH